MKGLSGKRNIVNSIVPKLDPEMRKEEVVAILVDANRTSDLFTKNGSKDILDDEINNLGYGSDAQTIFDALSNARKKYYSNVIGENVVDPNLEEMVENIILEYYSFDKDDNLFRPALKLIASEYLSKGAKATFQSINDLEKNKSLISNLRLQGVDFDSFAAGIEKTYHLSTGKNARQAIVEKIDDEFNVIYDCMLKMG